jgi:hypothetical protein
MWKLVLSLGRGVFIRWFWKSKRDAATTSLPAWTS